MQSEQQVKPSPESVSCTEWYPGAVDPVRSGVYQRRSYGAIARSTIYTWSYFEVRNKTWHCGFAEWDELGYRSPVADAELHGKSLLSKTDFEWRGVIHEGSKCTVNVRT